MSHFDHFPNSYFLLCPELHQVQHLKQFRCNGVEFFKQNNETWFWNTFVKSNLDIQRVQTFHPRARSDGKLSALERLPSELIEEILDQLLDNGNWRMDNMENVLALGLSSSRLWPIVLRRIHRDYQRAVAFNWAGKNVGYHGAYSRFTKAQVQNYGVEDSMFMHLPLEYWCWNHSLPQLENEWRDKATAIRSVWNELSESEWDRVDQDLSQEYKYPKDRVWVLRNLTTKQFVRSDKLQPPKGAIPDIKSNKVPISNRSKIAKLWNTMKIWGKTRQECNHDEEPLTLAQVFLVLTCYVNKIGIPFLERIFNFQQGPWIGHAFELVTIEDHVADSEPRTIKGKNVVGSCNEMDEIQTKPWVDVSELAAADVGSLRWSLRQSEEVFGKARSPRSMERDKAFWRVIAKTRRANRSWTGLVEFV